MTERRFNEAEVAAIFERATEEQQTGQRQLTVGDGMTLAQLQEIGREIGVAPELVAQAAKAIERGGQPTSRHLLGLTVGVGRTIDLDRALTDEEWERIVVDLRETFDARGVLKREGSLRQWTNGNLQALLEPTATGQRIRLRTVKGDARSLIIGGIALLGVAAVALISATMRGAVSDAATLSTLGTLTAMGVAMFGLGAIRLPGWARLRQRQMEEIAQRVALVTNTKTTRRLED
jgi:hypothetical protein